MSSVGSHTHCTDIPLYVEQYTCESGAKLHFGFERVDEENVNFWHSYSEKSSHDAQAYGYLCSLASQEKYPEYPTSLSDHFGYSKNQYDQIMQFIQRKGYFNRTKNPFWHGGFATMASVLRTIFKTDKKIYLVFASSVPIEKFSIERKFQNIVMSFVWITSDKSRTVTHEGIFRNPSEFLDATERHRGIAMSLHSFAAKVALTYFNCKKYMVNHPMPSMAAAMSRCLGSDLHLGSNLELRAFDSLSKEHQALIRQHTPILHCVGRIQKIAKEGIDLSQYLDSLPDERAEVVSEAGEQLMHHAPMTMGSLIAVVDLTKLSKSS